MKNVVDKNFYYYFASKISGEPGPIPPNPGLKTMFQSQFRGTSKIRSDFRGNLPKAENGSSRANRRIRSAE